VGPGDHLVCTRGNGRVACMVAHTFGYSAGTRQLVQSVQSFQHHVLPGAVAYRDPVFCNNKQEALRAECPRKVLGMNGKILFSYFFTYFLTI
jgi:hypothetical protein